MWRKQCLYLKKILCVQVKGTQLLFFVLSVLLHVFLIFSISTGNVVQTGTPVFSNPLHAAQIAEVNLTRGIIERKLNRDENADVLIKDREAKLVTSSSQLLSVAELVARAPILKLATSYYFSANDLSVRPVVIRDLPLDLKLVAPGLSEQVAILRMQINEYGYVDQVVMEDSLLEDASQNIIKNEFSKLQFFPGEIDGVPVKSELKIEVILAE